MPNALSQGKLGSLILTTQTARYIISSDNVMNPLGKGSFGIVYKCERERDGSVRAIKQIDKNSGIPLDKIQSEMNIMHDIGIKAVQQSVGHLIYSEDEVLDEKYAYVVMPFFDSGSLSLLINRSEIKSIKEIFEYFRQLCYGLNCLHSQFKIIHRDLKTDNIFVTKNTDTKNYTYKYLLYLGDLGLIQKADNMKMTISVGTCYTMAPEVLTGMYGMSADLYSFGCILFKIITGKEPFPGSTISEVNNAKKANIIKVIPKKEYEGLNYIAYALIEGMLQYDQKNRIVFSENDGVDANNVYLLYLLDVVNLYLDYTLFESFELCAKDMTKLDLLKYRKQYWSQVDVKCQNNNVNIIKQEMRDMIIKPGLTIEDWRNEVGKISSGNVDDIFSNVINLKSFQKKPILQVLISSKAFTALHPVVPPSESIQVIIKKVIHENVSDSKKLMDNVFEIAKKKEIKFGIYNMYERFMTFIDSKSNVPTNFAKFLSGENKQFLGELKKVYIYHKFYVTLAMMCSLILCKNNDNEAEFRKIIDKPLEDPLLQKYIEMSIKLIKNAKTDDITKIMADLTKVGITELNL
jgi:serine/threonine protein kinase